MPRKKQLKKKNKPKIGEVELKKRILELGRRISREVKYALQRKEI